MIEIEEVLVQRIASGGSDRAERLEDLAFLTASSSVGRLDHHVAVFEDSSSDRCRWRPAPGPRSCRPR